MAPSTDARELYLRVREKEGRLYPDEVVARLPEFAGGGPLSAEWRVRAASAGRLTSYLAGLARPLRILDLGCGNGWLAHRLAAVPAARVVGLECNRFELGQAARVFPRRAGLAWIEADILRHPFRPRTFDVIVVASAIQYFRSLPRLIRTLGALLGAEGEIHILDSPLYTPEAAPAARARSRKYYRDLGFPGMAARYHHHCWPALAPFRPVRLPHPESPFPWVRLRFPPRRADKSLTRS